MKVSDNQKWYWGVQRARDPGLRFNKSWFFVMDELFNSLSFYGLGVRLTIRKLEFHVGRSSNDRLSRALEATSEEIKMWQSPEKQNRDNI